MKITGIEKAPQEIRNAMGKCEVCGEQATAIVQDLFELIPFASQFATDIESAGLHRYCAEHERKPEIVQLLEGPMQYMHRTEKP
jgi:hypothetical protein